MAPLVAEDTLLLKFAALIPLDTLLLRTTFFAGAALFLLLVTVVETAGFLTGVFLSIFFI